MNPAAVYVALHRSGADEGLFVSDGTANLWRYGLDFGAWSPVAQPLMGSGAIASIETSLANWNLCLGSNLPEKYSYFRDTGSFTDDGTGYLCDVIVGSLIVAPPGQIAMPEKVILQVTKLSTGTWTYPTLSVLPNNVSGTFTVIPNPVGEPYQLAGGAYESTNPLTKAHQWKNVQVPLPQIVQNLQVQVAFANDTTQSEIVGIGLL